MRGCPVSLSPPSLKGRESRFRNQKLNQSIKIILKTLSKMERTLSQKEQEFLNAARAAGISEDRQKKMIIDPVTVNSLPKNGTFTGYTFSGEGKFTHPRMITNTGDSISFSAIKLIAHNGSRESVILKRASATSKIPNGIVLSGKAINPTLLRSDAALAEYLEGKTFTAKPVDVIVLPVRTKAGTNEIDPFMDETEAINALTVKTVYTIELKN